MKTAVNEFKPPMKVGVASFVPGGASKPFVPIGMGMTIAASSF